jgi:hypothetical protein
MFGTATRRDLPPEIILRLASIHDNTTDGTPVVVARAIVTFIGPSGDSGRVSGDDVFLHGRLAHDAKYVLTCEGLASAAVRTAP